MSQSVVWIYDWFGIATINPAAVSDFLDEANGEDVEITIISGGGDVYSGAEIYTSLRDYHGNSTVKVVFAASAASVIAMGGKKVLMSPAGQMMIHNSSTSAWGDRNDMNDTATMLKSVDDSIANAYVNKTGMSREELLGLMDQETWMDAVKAKELGFVDEIMFSETVPQTTNSAAGGQVIPEEVINKIRNEFLSKGGFISQSPALGDGGPEGIIDLNAKTPLASVNTNRGGAPTGLTAERLKNQISQMKGENKPMDLNQLKNEHPDLYNEVVSLATTAERSRISALTNMEGAPGAKPFIKDAITNGETAGDVAMKIVQASITRVGQEGTQRQQDSDDSGVKNVSPEAPVITVGASNDDAENEQAVNNMIEYAKQLQNKKGGRK
ncbi:head maturation protease, ClpP-related [Paenibacillus sp. FSL P2-0322]|uniref:head maturation protease, ClpP-related n=1 Tax=Paenibacillus sp. FSL P2-0322 TaxID=2921628 RepID=UPI0030D47A40